MTHPHNLHAAAALASLRAAWPLLHAARGAEDDRGVLRSVAASQARSGGHGDGLADTVVATLGRDSYADRIIEQVTGEVEQACFLVWSALRQRLPGPPFEQLAAGIPRLNPTTARDVAAGLAIADRDARRALRLPPDWWPLPGNPPCPVCGHRLLRVQTSAPDSGAWTVVCTHDLCRCHGRACACGMEVREERVRHIWGAGSELVAKAIAGVFGQDNVRDEGTAA